MTTLARITVFPIKSLDGIDVASACVLPSGALENDRRFALVDEEGQVVNGKRCPELLRIRAAYDQAMRQVTLSLGAEMQTFSLADERQEVARWCSTVLGVACRLAEDADKGFPDDSESPGPTLISSGTLEAIRAWFPLLDLGETRRRFRANLEVAVAEPFWEDQLLSAANPTRQFTIGFTRWWADKICQRCAVPSRDSRTSEPTGGFAKRFSEMREQTLAGGAPRDEFDHFYRLAINTRLDATAGESLIRVGDKVAPLGGSTR